MGRRLILDTAIFIGFERGDYDRAQFDNDELSTAAVCLAEFRLGAQLADSAERRAARLAALSEIQLGLEVLAYTETTAQIHGELLAHARKSGRPRGPHDLIIAAHAVQTNRIVVSWDAKARFGDLPNVRAIMPD